MAQPAAPAPFPTPTQPVRRGRRPPQEPPWARQKGQLVSPANGNSYPGEEGKMLTGRLAAVASAAVAHGGSKDRSSNNANSEGPPGVPTPTSPWPGCQGGRALGETQA